MTGDENFLARWSRRKSASKDPVRAEQADPAPQVDPVAAPPPPSPGERTPLPPIETLTPESDFAPFMEGDVEGDLRNRALKSLFSDPHFNVLDMMDVYMDDYSIPDPLPESWLGKLEQMSRLGDRGGRDREEAERRRALAGDEAREPDGDADSRLEAPAPADLQSPHEVKGNSLAGEPAIPSLPSGDSDT